jgi:Spy/CpxP family protein refolding chaperone
MLLRSANLTSDQQAQVHQLMQAAHSQNQPLEQQLRQIHEQIANKLTGTASVTASDITPLQQQGAKVRDQLATQMIQTAIQIRTILTPAQLQTISQLHQKLAGLHDQMDDLLNPGGQAPPDHE